MKLATAAGLWLRSQLAKHRKLHSDLLPTVGIFDRAGLSLEGVFNFCMRARERERKKKKGERERKKKGEREEGERPTEGKGGGGESEEEEWRNREGGREGWKEEETNRQTGQLGPVRSPPTLSSLPVICIQPRHDLSAPLS